MSINVAVLGCGMMGQEHISYMKEYSDLRVKFLCDPNPGSIEAALALLSEKADEAKPQVFADEMEMFKRVSEVDLLLIATPNYLHTPQLLRWAQYPITILVEKPVAVSANQIHALRSASKSFRANIWVAMEYRYIPAIQKLIQLLPEIGPIKSITIRENRFPFLSKVGEWNKEISKSGDTLVEKCCHFFDLFRLISKEEMNSCSTKVHRGLLSKHYGYDKRTDNPVPIIESAYVLLDFLPSSSEHDDTDTHWTKEGESKCNVDDHSAMSVLQNGSSQYHNPTMGCLELCMFAEGSRHQEEVIVTGLKGRLEAYLPENKVFFYLRPNDSEWSDHSKPPPRSSIKEQVIDCSDLKQVYSFADEVPKHSGYHYSSTAIEWKFLIDEIKKVRSGKGNFAPQVSLSDGIAAVEMGITAQRNIYSSNCRSTASFAPSIGMESIVACSSPSKQLLSLALGLTPEQKALIAEAVIRESQTNLLRYGGECVGLKDHFEAIRF